MSVNGQSASSAIQHVRAVALFLGSNHGSAGSPNLKSVCIHYIPSQDPYFKPQPYFESMGSASWIVVQACDKQSGSQKLSDQRAGFILVDLLVCLGVAVGYQVLCGGIGEPAEAKDLAVRDSRGASKAKLQCQLPSFGGRHLRRTPLHHDTSSSHSSADSEPCREESSLDSKRQKDGLSAEFLPSWQTEKHEH